MKNVISKINCSGCMVCKHKCPKKCIHILETREGFSYPYIEEEQCIHCGLCTQNCPFNNELFYSAPSKAYAVQRSNKEKCMKSSSGGLFSALAEAVLIHRGVVFGVCMSDEFEVYHKFIDTINDIDDLRGSKYVESDLRNTFEEAFLFLESGKQVLFSGTPCQIAGLRGYLKKDYKNLITIDLICNGVPSYRMFKEYRLWLNSRYGEVKKISFRDKSAQGWGLISSFESSKKKFYNTATLDPYSYGFEKLYFNRLSCYGCKYADERRVGDITIGDYWGIEEVNSNLDIHRGVSVSLLNSDKGAQLFDEIVQAGEIEACQTGMEAAQKHNSNMKTPKMKPPVRDVIYDILDSEGFEAIRKRFLISKGYWVKKILIQARLALKIYFRGRKDG